MEFEDAMKRLLKVKPPKKAAAMSGRLKREP
jgi:hypothetical protein